MLVLGEEGRGRVWKVVGGGVDIPGVCEMGLGMLVGV